MLAQSPPAGVSVPGPNPARRAGWPEWAAAVLLAAGTIAIYRRSFSVPMLLDDRGSIVDNASIRHLWPLGPVWSPPVGAGVGGRPLLNFTYALNYAAGGTAVAGYHLVNLIVHLLAGGLLFALARHTLQRPLLAPRFGAAATPLALAIAALWAWHPVQTESVTYLTQRAESLMGLFYLGTVYGFARYAEGEDRRRWLWAGLSVLACLLGVGTKEVIVTAPVMALLYDRTFISGSWVRAWQRHRALYLALAATWLPLGYLLTSLHSRGMGFGSGVAWWSYALTECRVVVRYLELALWPSPLVFDYGSYVPVALSAVWPYALVLGALLIATVAALRQSPAVGFAAAWFFLILAPASSVVPIAGEPMAESRLYLPLAGIAALAVLGGFALAGRRSFALFAVGAAALAAATVQRNRVYRSEQAIWSDTVAQDPANARAHLNLGNVWAHLPGQDPAAIAEYETALQLQPDFAEAHNNLGSAWSKLPGRLPDAIAQYEEAIRLDPKNAEAHLNLGNAWTKTPGRLADAAAEYREALRLNPDSAEAHNNLGIAWSKQPGRTNEAIAEYRAALRARPDYAQAHNNLGDALVALPGRFDQAIAEYQAALRLQPDYAEAHFNLALAWSKRPERRDDAIAHYQAAIRLKPDYLQAHTNLGNVWLTQPGRWTEAIAEYEAALRLDPNLAEVRSNLGSALMAAHRPGEAIAQFEAALRLNPNLALAHFNLALALLSTPSGIPAAEAQLAAGLRLQPDNPAARKILAELQASPP
jgi:tetratricopeptide (TPR) repeat protein